MDHSASIVLRARRPQVEAPHFTRKTSPNCLKSLSIHHVKTILCFADYYLASRVEKQHVPRLESDPTTCQVLIDTLHYQHTQIQPPLNVGCLRYLGNLFFASHSCHSRLPRIHVGMILTPNFQSAYYCLGEIGACISV